MVCTVSHTHPAHNSHKHRVYKALPRVAVHSALHMVQRSCDPVLRSLRLEDQIPGCLHYVASTYLKSKNTSQFCLEFFSGFSSHLCDQTPPLTSCLIAALGSVFHNLHANSIPMPAFFCLCVVVYFSSCFPYCPIARTSLCAVDT